MSTVLTRRAASALLAVAALALSACGVGSTSTTSDAPASATGAAVEEGAFPVTIEHKYGSTTLTAPPTRVVSVGLVEQDALLALGTPPVAVTTWFGEADGQIFPWATDALGDAALPEVLDDSNGLQLEKIRLLKPDLIIGQYAGMTQEEFDQLKEITPNVVAQPKDVVDFGVSWQQSTLTIGTALGRPAAAQDLIDSVQELIAEQKAAHPEFAGQQAVVATAFEGIFFYGPQDPRARILEELGFTFPPALKGLEGAEFGTSVSAEQTEKFDVDTVVWLSSEKEIATLTGGLWARTTAAKEGRNVFITDDDGDYVVAFSMVTPLSIPYVLDRYVPQLAAAVDGDPATVPPSPTD